MHIHLQLILALSHIHDCKILHRDLTLSPQGSAVLNPEVSHKGTLKQKVLRPLRAPEIQEVL